MMPLALDLISTLDSGSTFPVATTDFGDGAVFHLCELFRRDGLVDGKERSENPIAAEDHQEPDNGKEGNRKNPFLGHDSSINALSIRESAEKVR